MSNSRTLGLIQQSKSHKNVSIAFWLTDFETLNIQAFNIQTMEDLKKLHHFPYTTVLKHFDNLYFVFIHNEKSITLTLIKLVLFMFFFLNKNIETK